MHLLNSIHIKQQKELYNNKIIGGYEISIGWPKKYIEKIKDYEYELKQKEEEEEQEEEENTIFYSVCYIFIIYFIYYFL